VKFIPETRRVHLIWYLRFYYWCCVRKHILYASMQNNYIFPSNYDKNKSLLSFVISKVLEMQVSK